MGQRRSGGGEADAEVPAGQLGQQVGVADRHLVAHAKIARKMGIAPDHVWVCEDGHQLELNDDGLKAIGKVPAGYLYVDGTIGDVGHGVLRDRKVLAEEGVVVVIVTLDVETGALITKPEIVTRGWVRAVPSSTTTATATPFAIP